MIMVMQPIPYATVWVPKADAEFWLDSATTEKIPEIQHWFIDVAQNATAPYIKAGRFQTFENGDDLLNGLVKVIGLPGHTPGHSGFRIESAGETILFWGDITHLPTVQLSHAGATDYRSGHYSGKSSEFTRVGSERNVVNGYLDRRGAPGISGNWSSAPGRRGL
ncbi:MBL fold metallo-hydrolase [Pantoea sp. Eser]|nr:MBL fold metallo-hydrolase [Pantoea sp. Eser]